MNLPAHKTKIVCTIGPASESSEILESMIRAGMDVARINFSHGDFAGHQAVIKSLRAAASAAGRPLAILADLPGPKIRIGQLAREPIELKAGESFALTTEEVPGDAERVSVNFPSLPQRVKPGDTLFLNDGLIQLEVLKTGGPEVQCRVVVGGELRSRKGLNLPGVDLGIGAFTDYDFRCLQFAREHRVDAIGQSFVESAADLTAVRRAAQGLAYDPFIVAKIERSRALSRIDEILESADAIMIARGDLGVEIPIERIALVQKQLMRKANSLGKPVITATQMLESMTANRRPTRAEATDVANAILDGTDAVMLSGESAMGQFPVEAVRMLAQIAEAIEPHRHEFCPPEKLSAAAGEERVRVEELIPMSVESALERMSVAAVIVATRSGATARQIARLKLPAWIAAVSSREKTCRDLQFSWGIHPVHEPEEREDWDAFAREWVRAHGIAGDFALLIEGPSRAHPEANRRLEIVDLRKN
jgi:pyruvate kinase